MRGKRKVAAVAIAASLALLPMEAATAHRSQDPSTISIRAMKRKFQGRVKSTKNRCLKNRNVTVFKKRPGNDKKIGKTKTISGGHWKVRKRPKKGKTYYAKVSKRIFKKHGHVHRCKAARSNNVTR